MRKLHWVAICSFALLESALSLNRAHAGRLNNDTSIDFARKLAERGYEPSEAGMREVLTARDRGATLFCLKYIEQEQFVNLLPDVESYLAFLEDGERYVDEGSRLLVVQCILAIDKTMTPEVLDGYMKRIRRLLHDVGPGDKDYRGVPIHAYNALLAAQKYKAVDIYDDLLYLSVTNRMKAPSETEHLFDLYGDRVSESDIDMMLSTSQDRPKWHNYEKYVLRRAREHGFRLDSVE